MLSRGRIRCYILHRNEHDAVMLCFFRTRNGGAFSLHIFKLSASSLYSSHPSPEKTPSKFSNSIVPTKPITFNDQFPPHKTKASSSTYLAVSICSLLSNHVPCNVTDIDSLLGRYKGNLSSDLVLRVLMSYKQLGRANTLAFFSWAGSHMGFHLDDSVVEYMADFLGRRKLFDDMKCLLMTISMHKGKVSSRTFSICIRFLGRQGRIQEALSLFDEMETVFRCKPDNLVCNNMLYVLCKRQSSEVTVELALSIFRRIEFPDTYSCSNMLVGLCRIGRLEAALEIFGRMDKIGVRPTRSALNVLIGELCSMSAKEGSLEKVRVKNTRRPYTILVPNKGGNSGVIRPAVEVFRAVFNAGLLPSTFVVVKLMSELCRIGNTKEAVEVLRIAEERKLTCLEEGYSMVIKALCEHRRVEEVSRLFERMLDLRLKPKLVVYNSIISMLCKLGNLSDATKVFEIMNKKRCIPDNLTYIPLVHAHGERKNWEVAYELSIEMLGLGLIPHFHTYNLVDSILREHDRLDLCSKLERKLENQKLQKLCKIGELDGAYEKAKSMLEKGIHLSAPARDTFKHVFQKCGKLKVAQQLLEMNDRVHEEPEQINRT